MNNRCPKQRVDGIDPVLRCLRRDAVVHAVLWIHPEVRSGLRGGAERNKNAARDILLRQTQFGGHDAVDSKIELRAVGDLMQVDVHRAGDRGDPLPELLGEFSVSLTGHADDLDIQRRGEAEVEDLTGHVGGLKEEVALGEPLRKLSPEERDGGGGRLVVRRESDEDLAVRVADRAVVDIGHDRERLGQAHVVQDHGALALRNELADCPFDLAEDPFGFFDSRSRRRPDVHPDLSGIHGGEKIPADSREEHRGADREAHQDRDRKPAVIDHPASISWYASRNRPKAWLKRVWR